VFTPVLAKHSKSFSLIDCISVGVDRMQRNFEPMRKQVEAWQRSELADVAAKAEGLHFMTETCMPSKQRSVPQRITARNLGRGRRKIQMGFDLRAGVVYKRGASAFFPKFSGRARQPDRVVAG
jgi:hypothetical protein